MSRDRLPDGIKDVLLVVFYQDGFCTAQAVWDKAIFPIIDLVAGKSMVFHGFGYNVFLRTTKNSAYVNRKLGLKIAEKWLNGEYMVIEPPLLPEIQSRDWLS